MKSRKLPPEGKKIVKPEDRVWREWYDKLSEKEHDQMLSRIGLSADELDEFKQEMKEDPLEGEALPQKKAKK